MGFRLISAVFSEDFFPALLDVLRDEIVHNLVDLGFVRGDADIAFQGFLAAGTIVGIVANSSSSVAAARMHFTAGRMLSAALLLDATDLQEFLLFDIP